VYLSRNSTWSSDDVNFASKNFNPIPAGATADASLAVTIPSTTSVGSYYVVFVVDPVGTTAESNETNNILTRAVSVQ
jgi:subtilase family serine protease